MTIFDINESLSCSVFHVNNYMMVHNPSKSLFDAWFFRLLAHCKWQICIFIRLLLHIIGHITVFETETIVHGFELFHSIQFSNNMSNYLEASLSFAFELAGDRFLLDIIIFIYSSFKFLNKMIPHIEYHVKLMNATVITHTFCIFSLSKTNFSYSNCADLNFIISDRFRLMMSFL